MTAPRLSGLVARWGAGAALAIGVHVGGAAALLVHWQDQSDAVASAPVILVDLAPVATAPAIVPTELPPGPLAPQVEEQPEPTPEKQPDKQVDLPPDPVPAPSLSLLPPPKPEKKVEKKPKQKHASLASAPSNAELKSERTAAPAPAVSRDSTALPNWKSALVARLERYKRYPPQAQARNEHGIAQLAFSVDRNGGVHGARIARSSGSSLLDAATLELLQRAAPLPPPPPDVRGAQIAISVPIRYNTR